MSDRVWIILQKRTHTILQEAAFPSRDAAKRYAEAAYTGTFDWYVLELPVLTHKSVDDLVADCLRPIPA